MNPLDRADIQGNLLRGYHLPCAEHWFARIDDARAARTLLSELRVQVETAEPWPRRKKPASTLNIALSYAGLKALGVPAPLLSKLPVAFREGMAARAGLLGDDLEAYDSIWRSGRVHVWFSVHARDLESLRERVSFVTTRAASRVELLDYVDRAQRLPGGVEHFGFPDGISNPRVADGMGGPTAQGNGVLSFPGAYRPFAAGEFLLGHVDEVGELSGEGLPLKLIENGTFVVYRKLEQDVRGFRRYVSETARRAGESPELIAAKLMGRWQNGLPLVAPAAQKLAAARGAPANDVAVNLNDFGYADDPNGAACPLGAHIRRANPRDANGFAVLSDRHRLLRRSMTYGPPLPRSADPGAPADEERGLVFIAMNADLERQYEYVQRHWLNDGAAARQARDRDPVCGAHVGPAKLVIQGDASAGRAPVICSDLPRFVTPRGGEYFFMPGMRALFALSQGSFADLRALESPQVLA
jgi:Dyp-type peroxidase family